MSLVAHTQPWMCLDRREEVVSLVAHTQPREMNERQMNERLHAKRGVRAWRRPTEPWTENCPGDGRRGTDTHVCDTKGLGEGTCSRGIH